MSDSPRMRGKRQLIQVGFNVTVITQYERAQTRGCWDLRFAGPNSSVKITSPTGQIHYEPSLDFESVPNEAKDFYQFKRDQKAKGGSHGI